MLRNMNIKVDKKNLRAVRKQNGLQVRKKQRKRPAFPSKTNEARIYKSFLEL